MRLQKARITARELDVIIDDIRNAFESDEEQYTEEDLAASVLHEAGEMAWGRVDLRHARFMGQMRPRIRMATDGGMVFTWTPRRSCEYCGMPRR